MENSELKERDLVAIQQKIAYSFKNPMLLEKALYLFSGYTNRILKEEFHRLVFLGDSLISFVVSQRAYHKLAHLKEGALMRLRGKLTKEETLKEYFFNLSLDKIVPSIGVYFSTLKEAEKNAPAASTLKAFLAALHADSDFKVVSTFFNRFCLPAAKPIIQDKHHFDWRRKLQEWCDRYKKNAPRYLLLEEIGPEHARTYKMGLFLEDELLAKSEGPTKKKAANLAAAKAMNKVKLWDVDFDSNLVKEGSIPG